MMEPIRVAKTINPVSRRTASHSVTIYDMGQNFAGWIRMKVSGPRGASVVIRYAEILQPPTSQSKIFSEMIYTDNLRGAAATDEYILRGDEHWETFEPRFTYHGFRYVQVHEVSWTRSVVEYLEGIVVHSFSPSAGSFDCSSHVINQIQSNILWGQKSNLMSIPTDCPQRDERNGWSGDAALTVDEALFNFKLGSFYTNHLQNILEAQKQAWKGQVPDTVPYTIGSSDGDPKY